VWSHSASHRFLSFQSSYIRHWLGGSSWGPLSSPCSANLWKLSCCLEPPLWLLWGGRCFWSYSVLSGAFLILPLLAFQPAAWTFSPFAYLNIERNANCNGFPYAESCPWKYMGNSANSTCNSVWHAAPSSPVSECKYLISLHHQITPQWSILWLIWLLKRAFTQIWIG
jgi:hypothetical protein